VNPLFSAAPSGVVLIDSERRRMSLGPSGVVLPPVAEPLYDLVPWP
jgi:hypothetical protein